MDKKDQPRPQPQVQAQVRLQQQADNRRNYAIQSFFVFVVACLLYANTFRHDYAVDDTIVITKNTLTAKGFKGIPQIMQTDAFYGFFGEGYKLVEGGRYRPLSIVTFAMENQIFGDVIKDAQGRPILDKQGDKNYTGKPHISHAINIILFGLTGVLIFYLLANLLNTQSPTFLEWNVPLLTALLFVAHPIHTEAVANIKGRDEIMGMLGALLTLYCAVLYVKRNKPVFLVLTFVSWTFALLSKENAITFLAVVPLTFYFFTKAKVEKYLTVVAPMLVLTVIYVALRKKFTDFDLTQTSPEILNNPFVYATKGERFATISYTFGDYIRLLVYPHPLTHDYYFDQVPIIGWDSWKAVVPLFANLALIGFAVWGVVRKNIIAYAILYYYITMSIVSNVFFTVGIAMNERFLYLASLGFCLIIAVLLVKVTNYFRVKSFDYKKVLNPLPVAAVMVLILAGYAVKTYSRNLDWKDDFTLFKQDAKNSPNSAKIYNALGGEYLTQAAKPGVPDTTAKKYVKEAEKALEKSLKIYPDYLNALLLMGNAKYKIYDSLPEAAYYYQRTIALKPEYFEGNFNLGCILLEKKRPAESVPYFKKAISINERKNAVKVEPYYNLAEAYAQVMQLDSAIGVYRRIIQVTNDRSHHAVCYNKIGKLYDQKDDKANAAINFKKARELDPTNMDYVAEDQPDVAIESFRKEIADTDDPIQQAGFYYKIGKTYGQRKGDLESAIVNLKKAIELDPATLVYYEDLSVAYGLKGDYQNTIATLEKGIQVNPDYSKFYLNLGVTYQRMGQVDKANQSFAKQKTLEQQGK